MANTPVNGTKYLVRASTGASNAMETLVCLTTNSFTLTSDSIDTSSKCSGGFATSVAGRVSWTLTAEGQAIAGVTDTGTVSYNKLFNAAKAGTTLSVEMYNMDDEDDILRGTARVTNLEKTAPDNANTTYNVTFTGVGEPFNTPAA